MKVRADTTIKLWWGVRGIGAQVLVSGMGWWGLMARGPLTQQSKKATKKWQLLEERQRGQRGQGEERGNSGYHFVVQK
jgi:hypothetical protein